MTEERDVSLSEPTSEGGWKQLRPRDFTVLTLIGWGVIILLSTSGALGIAEALMSMLTMGAGGLAYFVGSSPDQQLATAPDTAETANGEEAPNALIGLVQSISAPAILFDADDRLIAHNKAAAQVLRFPARSRLIAGAVLRQPELLKAIGNIRLEHTPLTREVVMPYAAEEIWLADISFVEPIQGVLITLTDHTAVKRAERARADFLANASHELRTPLTSLAGFIETMQGPAKDDKASWDRFLDIMHAQTQRMSRLIADLLSLSRIELDEHRRPDSAEDLFIMANDAVDALRPVAQDRAIHLRLEGPDAPTPVTAIRDEMIQMVQNLTDNAMKYSRKEDTVYLSVGIASTEEEARAASSRLWPSAEHIAIYSPPPSGANETVWLRIEDQGTGIEAQHLPRLGERFYRADKSRGGDVPGTGLGLAIVKHIMTRHNGGLAVESLPGKGTAFGVWLPLRKGSASKLGYAQVSQ